MKAAGQMLLAVLVISVWVVALVWVVTSVSQIAVDRVTTVHIPPGCATTEVSQCLP